MPYKWDYSLTNKSPEYMRMWRRNQCRCGHPLFEEVIRRRDGTRYTVLSCYTPIGCHTHWQVDD